jgi:hypothetical protein
MGVVEVDEIHSYTGSQKTTTGFGSQFTLLTGIEKFSEFYYG